MTSRLSGRTALVTGARRGIGRAIALEFAREGADVVVNDVAGMDEANAVCDEIRSLGRRAVAVGADVAERDQVEAMMERAWRELGPLDVLVNNAGIETIVPFLELRDEEWERVTSVNLKGGWLCAQAFARRLVQEGRGGPSSTSDRSRPARHFPVGRTTHRPSAVWRR